MDLASEAVDDKEQVCVVCFGFIGHTTSSGTNPPNLPMKSNEVQKHLSNLMRLTMPAWRFTFRTIRCKLNWLKKTKSNWNQIITPFGPVLTWNAIEWYLLELNRNSRKIRLWVLSRKYLFVVQVATRTYKKQYGSPLCMHHPRQWETLRYINIKQSIQSTAREVLCTYKQSGQWRQVATD